MIDPIHSAAEGLPDEAAIVTLCDRLQLPLGTVYRKSGKGNLDRSLPAFNASAKHAHWLVLRDMDHDANCAAELRSTLMPRPAPKMVFRIVVRAIEAWFLADNKTIANFLSVPISRIPSQPETIDNPKEMMVNLARRSRRRDIREDMVPRTNSGASEGPAYAGRLMEYALYHWQPLIAQRQSESLRRCINRLRQLKA